jgi:hypothetical protein
MAELIPEVLDALTERFGRLGVQTILGPSREWLEPELFAVGVSTGDVDAVEQTSTRAGLGAKRAHAFDVVNIAHVRTGDADPQAMQRITTRVFELVAWARQVVADDRTLGGLVMRADLTSTNYLPRLDAGAVAVVEFRVRIDAHR